MIEAPNYHGTIVTTENRATLDQTLTSLEEKCRKCKPLTALTCVTECKTWKLKNQVRKLHEKMNNPNYLELLMNTLKNRRRLELLDMFSKRRCSISNVQQRMFSLGYRHSQQTILEEYVQPLIDIGLVQDGHNPFDLTVLGCKVNELVKDSHDLEEALPPHSECYEERTLTSMQNGPKTYEEIRGIVPARSAARVLSRLQREGFVQTSKEKNYVFFFKTKRSPSMEKLTSTESRVYENIGEEGVYAKKLADISGISLRRTYKYVRKLKGKKLVFERKKPLTYSLTDRGAKLASMVRSLSILTAETRTASDKFLEEKELPQSEII